MCNRVRVQEVTLNGRGHCFFCRVRVCASIFRFGYNFSFDGTIQKVGIFLQSYVARGERKRNFSNNTVTPHFTDGKRDGVIEILAGEFPKHAAYCIHARVLMLGFTNLFDLLFPIVRLRQVGVGANDDLGYRMAQSRWT